TQQRVAELATINNLSQAVSSQLELRALVELVVETVSRTFNSPNAYVALYDGQTNMLQIPYMLEQGKPISVPAFPLGEGVSSVIVKSRQALFVNRDTERYLVGLGAKLTGAPAQSFIGVPMVAGEDVIGVISVQDVEQEGRFTESDVRLLSTIAASVGVAIQNVRLFEESQRRAGQLAALNDLGRAISGELGQEAILRLLAEHIQRLMIVDTFWVALYRLETDTFFFPLRYEAGQYFPPVDGPAQSFSLIQAALQSREPRLILRLAEGESDHAEQHGPAGVLLSHSLILAPLVVGDKTLGVISAQAYAPNAYLSEHLALMVGAAGQTAVALENARLFAETQRRAEQLATAAEVSRASISMLNPDELIVQTVELIRERFDLYYAALFLVDAAGEWAVLRHATGEAGRALLERGHRLQVGGNSMIGQAAARRQARIALDVGKEPVRFANPLLPDTRSELALPLAVGEIVLGALSVQSTQPNAFSDDDVAVLQTMADQIAIALRNAQLLSEAQRTQAFLDSVIENLPAMLFVKDARELRFVRWNKAGEELMGLGRAEMIGRNDFDFFPQEEAEFFTSKDREVLTSGTLLDVPEEPIHTRHKGLRFLHTRKIPILDEAGTPQYLL
ncbi:MAG: GAF domain-containing protein, partial [Anaerolineales bacterium]